MRGSVTWLTLNLWILISVCGIFIGKSLAESVTLNEARQLRDEVEEMFFHAFNGYMKHAFPRDELKPKSCGGEDTLGGYALTLVDSLDTLALLGDKERFAFSVEWLGNNLRFDINKTVSVFETTIRVLGGLLSAHLIASDYATGMRIPSYENQLLHLAEDLAYRLLPAFDTPTGIPFGSVNLLDGVDENESKITSTAGGGTLTLEFGILSRLTNNPVFEQVTKNAVRGLWACRSKLNLVGAHINVFTGEWTQKDAGIGTSIDSYYEYLLKAFLLFGDEEYLYMFQEAYGAVMHYLFTDPWYVEVNMDSAAIVWPLFNSLQAFWPGLQVLAGDVDPAIRTHAAFYSVWKRYGFTPEGFNLATLNVQQGQKSYPLRPELAESTYWLYKATRDTRYLDVGRDIVSSLQYGARCPCGYCHITDVENHKQEDHMESFFLAETVKYLWLLFDLAVGADNLVESGPYNYIFSTEGHLLPSTPQISLVREHCTYYGAYCRSHNSSLRQELHSSDILRKSQEANGSGVHHRGWVPNALLSALPDRTTSSGSGLVKGFCRGLNHGQKIGVSFVKPQFKAQEVVSVDNRVANTASSKSNIVVSSPAYTESNGSLEESSKSEMGNPSPQQ
ncbi:alpha-mannosidase I MNS4-like isoform X1 [Chenopodium quinoa]|uniref:alpha-mannosidase I MNS4-like isoform X1 n=1 Tax=Chenopodium quinoa TaxID=63459 RepID=UPI000B78A1C9|nr:alpha-mannosidase I MNS4-like isoform X1 [Chenopodium quinoa]